MFSLGGLFRAIGRAFKTIIKWAVIAVVVAIAVTVTVAMLSSPGSLGASLAYWMWNTVLPPLISGLSGLMGISGAGAIAGPGGTGVFNPDAGSGLGSSRWRGYVLHQNGDEVESVTTRCPRSGTTPLCPGQGVPGRWEKIRGAAAKVFGRGIVALKSYELRANTFGEWLARRLEDGSPKIQIGTYSNGDPMYMGFGVGGMTRSARGFNPFVGKTPQQIDGMFRAKGFDPRGPDPTNGFGGYVNPRTGRSFHIDPANRFGEPPHVDVNRPRTYNGPLKKRKFLF